MANIKFAKGLTVAELEKAKALSAIGKSYRQIGLELNRSDKTIKKALTRTPEVMAEVQEMKRDIAAMYEGLGERILASIEDADIKKANLRDRVISAGVCTDKSRLIRGVSTENISQYHHLVESAFERRMHNKIIDGEIEE